MPFEEVLTQALAMLQRQERVSDRALKRQFNLDEAYLDGVQFEIIEIHREAVDQDGTMLVWAGPLASAPSPATPPPSSVSDPGSVQTRAPLAYTPSHLGEKILTTRGALEGERKHVTVLFADTEGSTELIQALDPEGARRLLDPGMMDAVHRFEGTVNQVLGGGKMALFGAPLTPSRNQLRTRFRTSASSAPEKGKNPLTTWCASWQPEAS